MSSTKAGYMPNVPEKSPPSAAPRASITDQVAELRALTAPSSRRFGDVGEDGGMGGIEESAQPHLQRGQGVQQPDVAGVADEQKGEDDSRPDQVGSDEYVFAVIAVGNDAGDGADEEWREHAHDEERADRQTRLGQQADERGRGDEVEPVAQQADDLAEPEKAEVAVIAEQVRVADGGLGGGICGHVVGVQWRVSCISTSVKSSGCRYLIRFSTSARNGGFGGNRGHPSLTICPTCPPSADR